jgi:D-galacturonate reductase
MNEPLQLTIVGGGMITADQLLPSIYHLQRTGAVGDITICALNGAPLAALRDDPGLAAAFPGQRFIPRPSFDEPADRQFPGLYREVLAGMPERQAVVVAVPDHLHYETVKAALAADQHVLSVKPLVLRHAEALEIETIARERGLFVGVEYHKRFDRRSLVARRAYREGRFGSFAMGEAKLIEPYYYRNSNFQNWFTVDRTDPFTYIGCHYVDLVYFITGLRPVEVSVRGVRGRFPNGNEAFLWSQGTVRWENGALLSVVNGLGYPDLAAGSNDQGLVMFCEGEGRSGMIRHDDHDRGVGYAYLDGTGPGGSHFNYVSPDYLKLVPWDGPGFRPVGYGYDSVEASILTMTRIEAAVRGMDPARSLAERRRLLADVDEHGIIATPANSAVNEQVVEAARESILSDGTTVKIG